MAKTEEFFSNSFWTIRSSHLVYSGSSNTMVGNPVPFSEPLRVSKLYSSSVEGLCGADQQWITKNIANAAIRRSHAFNYFQFFLFPEPFWSIIGIQFPHCAVKFFAIVQMSLDSRKLLPMAPTPISLDLPRLWLDTTSF